MKHDSILAKLQQEALDEHGGQHLKRTLNAGHLTLLGIGAIIGAGIFVTTGIVAAEYTGPAIIFSFIVAAFGCLFTALCYAEFAAMFPVSGSAYSYTSVAFGRFTGWLIGWCLVLEYSMAAATVAVGWAGYLRGSIASFGLGLPSFLAQNAVIDVPAIAIICILTIILLNGIKTSVSLNAILVVVKLSVLILFIIIGISYVNIDNWVPFLPENEGEYGKFGYSGILRGAAVIFYAYLGFDAVSTAAREAKNPQRTVPLGIIGSLAICTVLYIIFSLLLTGIAPYHILHTASPVSTALSHVGPQLSFLKVIVEFGALTGLTSVILVLLYGQSRILFAMARDGLLPAVFASIHPKRTTPSYGLVAGGVIAASAAAFFPIGFLSELISIGTLAAFIFVCAGILVLRRRYPDLPRSFKTPLAPLTCISGILTCGYMIVSLPLATWQRFLMWLVVGCLIYVAYGAFRKFFSRTPATAVSTPES